MRCERREGVAFITLDRPDVLNAWVPELGEQLLAVIQDASADPDVRAMHVTGAGRAFCAGADMSRPRAYHDDGTIDLTTTLRTVYNPIMLALREAPKPVVAAVNGPCAGIGVSFALAADLIVAAESSYFLLAFVNISLGVDGGASTHLVARVGRARAARLAMLGERLPAPTALDWGLIDDVCPDDELAATSEALAARLAGGPTVALASIKSALESAERLPLAEQVVREADLQDRHAETEDFREGVLAFAEKRKPQFRGR